MELTHVFHERVTQHEVFEGSGAPVKYASTPFGDRVVLVACSGDHILFTLIADDLASAANALREAINKAATENYPLELSEDVNTFLSSHGKPARRF